MQMDLALEDYLRECQEVCVCDSFEEFTLYFPLWRRAKELEAG
jgi:hypothetical protein